MTKMPFISGIIKADIVYSW